MRIAICASMVVFIVACGDNEESQPDLPREQLLDPEACQECHPRQFEEWKASMHAYAGDDPIFLAMNRRGQEETGGALGDFCVKCHAPVALMEGVTTDGLNLNEVPQAFKGVTCFFCHSAESVDGTHNNPITLATDGMLRAGIPDPKNPGHKAGYSALVDSDRFESSDMCGSCHDIVTPAGVHLERTYAEYLDSVFSKPFGAVATSCSTCHMFTDEGPIADVDGAPVRRRHHHGFPGVDVAITDWPGKDAQRELIQRDLDSTILTRLCVNPAGGGVELDVSLDDVNAGHNWPSGASADRRAWVRIEAFEGETRAYDSGIVAADQSVNDAAAADTNFWQVRDYIYKEGGVEEAHQFWDVREVVEDTLTPAVTNDPNDPRFVHAVNRIYNLVGLAPDRITMQVFIRPVGYDVIDDLAATGHLDAALKEQIPTFELRGAAREWTSDRGFGCVPQ